MLHASSWLLHHLHSHQVQKWSDITAKRTNQSTLLCPQPRSCLKASLRVDPEPEEEPGAGWICRKLHHRAEVATAVAAGTNTETRPLIQPIPQLRSTRPVTTQTTFGPATLQATRTVGKWVASKLPDTSPPPPPPPALLIRGSNRWTNQRSKKSILSSHVFNTQTFPSISWWKTLGATFGGKPPNYGRKTKLAVPGLWGPSCSPWYFFFFVVFVLWEKKKIKQEGILTGWPCPLSSPTFCLKQQTFLKYFLHAAAFSVLFLETRRGFKPVEWTEFSG